MKLLKWFYQNKISSKCINPTSNDKTFMKCNDCGDYFDMGNLSDVFYHEKDNHKPKTRN